MGLERFVGGRRSWACAGALAVLLQVMGLGVHVAGAGQVPQAATTGPLVSVAVSPYRVLDTRLGIGVGGATSPLGPEGEIDVQIAGVGPVPANAAGVVLNLTATNGTEAGYVTAWPTGEDRPTASVLNVTPGIDLPNMVTALLGGGSLSLYNFAGDVDLVADVAAYLVPGGSGGTAGPAGPQGPVGPTGPAGKGVASTQTLLYTGLSGVFSRYATLNGQGWYEASGGCARLGESSLMFDLALPDGAAITGYEVSYSYVVATATMSGDLHRVASDGTDAPVGPAWADATAATGARTHAVTVDPPQVVSPGAHYYLSLGLSAPAAVQVCAASVTYTLP